MTLRKARLVTRAELLRRVNRSKTRLYVDASPDGRLRNALTSDGRIDLDHIDVVNYCHEFGYSEPDTKQLVADAVKAEREKLTAPKGPPTTAGDLPYATPDMVADAADEMFEDSDDKAADEIMQMTLHELVMRYGKQARFLDYVRALKVLTDTRAKDEESARKRKEHVPMSLVLALTGHIDALQTALLSETTVAIRTKVAAMAKAGAGDKAIEKAVHDLISRTVRTTKETTERAIRSVYESK